jgi:hypothetical protein
LLGDSDLEAAAKTYYPDGDVLQDVGSTWWWFTNEMPRQERIRGNEVRGFSVSCHVTGTLLTVRFIRQGRPQVVFTRKPGATGCVETFKRKWEAGTLSFFADRFA